MNRRLFRSAFLAASLVSGAWAGPGLYGASGTAYVPGGLVTQDRFSLMGAGEAATAPSLRYLPIHLAGNGRFWNGRVEVGLSNTLWLVRDDSSGYDPGSSYAPVVPSLKVGLAEERQGPMVWGYAVGFDWPYGAYASATWSRRFPLVKPELTLGLGFPLVKLYAMGSARLQLCDLSGRELPLALEVDGAIAGSTDRLGEKEEAFVATAITTDLGRNLQFSLGYRRDAKYVAAPDRQNDAGRFQLRLTARLPQIPGASR